MNIGIVGSRRFKDYGLFKATVESFITEQDTIISGGAKGADQLAEDYANEYSIDFKVFKAEWDKYGNSAGMIRNGKIVEMSDFVLAFWDGKSKGTKDTIDKCKNVGKQVIVFDVFIPDEDEEVILPKGI